MHLRWPHFISTYLPKPHCPGALLLSTDTFTYRDTECKWCSLLHNLLSTEVIYFPFTRGKISKVWIPLKDRTVVSWLFQVTWLMTWPHSIGQSSTVTNFSWLGHYETSVFCGLISCNQVTFSWQRKSNTVDWYFARFPIGIGLLIWLYKCIVYHTPTIYKIENVFVYLIN